jgi:hypothetical protein
LSPDFTLFLITGVLFGVAVVVFIAWRFSVADALAFVLVAGLLPAVMDFLSSFAVQSYVYPGQSRLWVFSYIFFGWMGVCGTCMLIAEGILARPGEDMLTQRALWWQVPLATGGIAVLLDLFLDPIAVLVDYWLWLVESSVYYGIPLLNFVGWFVLTSLACRSQRELAWTGRSAVALEPAAEKMSKTVSRGDSFRCMPWLLAYEAESRIHWARCRGAWNPVPARAVRCAEFLMCGRLGHWSVARVCVACRRCRLPTPPVSMWTSGRHLFNPRHAWRAQSS